MKCPKCKRALKRVEVAVSGASSKVISYQCTNCDYFSFEPQSSQKVIEELRESPLKIRQRVVKLSKDRLGIYFSSHVTRSLNMKSGKEVSVSVPDKNHIIIEL